MNDSTEVEAAECPYNHREHMAGCVIRELAGGPLTRSDLNYRLSAPSDWRWFMDLLDRMETAGRVRHLCDCTDEHRLACKVEVVR